MHFHTAKVKVWQHETSTKVIRVGRYEHLRRSIRASASVGADVCVGRYEHLRRSMRMTKVGSMKRKRDGVKREKKSVKRKKEGCKRGERGVRGGCVKTKIFGKLNSKRF